MDQQQQQSSGYPLAPNDIQPSQQVSIPPLSQNGFEMPSGGQTEPNSSWSQDNPIKKPSRIFKVAMYSLFTIIPFIFFLYQSFPYGIIKEVITTKISEALLQGGLPMRITIGRLRPYWVTGLELNDVLLANVAVKDAKIKFSQMLSYIHLLPLLIGRLQISFFTQQGAGSLTMDTSLSIASLLKGGTGLRDLSIHLNAFQVKDFFNQLTAMVQTSSNSAMILIQPLVAKTTLDGNLTGLLQLTNPNPQDMASVTGNLDMDIKSGFLHINDETLQIPKQNFTKSKLSLKYEKGGMRILPATGFISQLLEVSPQGSIVTSSPKDPDGRLDLQITLGMKGEVEKNLGFIIPNMLRCPQLKNGILQAKIRGTFSNFVCE